MYNCQIKVVPSHRFTIGKYWITFTNVIAVCTDVNQFNATIAFESPHCRDEWLLKNMNICFAEGTPEYDESIHISKLWNNL